MQHVANGLRLVHGDISDFNVMLTAEGEGILNDWDHAKDIYGPMSAPTVSFPSASILG